MLLIGLWMIVLISKNGVSRILNNCVNIGNDVNRLLDHCVNVGEIVLIGF